MKGMDINEEGREGSYLIRDRENGQHKGSITNTLLHKYKDPGSHPTQKWSHLTALCTHNKWPEKEKELEDDYSVELTNQAFNPGPVVDTHSVYQDITEQHLAGSLSSLIPTWLCRVGSHALSLTVLMSLL